MTEFFGNHIGELNALGTAIVWAFAVILFKKSGESVHAIALNLFKGVLAVTLLVPTILIVGEDIFLAAPRGDYMILLISGGLGIGLADTLFFRSLNLLGAGLSAIVDCLYSPFIIGLSMLWLGESMSAVQLAGVVLIISAVLTTVAEKNSGFISRGDLIKGVIYGVAAMATMAVGIVMVKPVLDHSPLFWATEWRLVGGIVVLGFWLAFKTDRAKILSTLRIRDHRAYTVVGSFAGGYVAMIMWLAGMKYIQASTASALNQTSAVFVFVFAALILKEPITIVRLAAIALGVGGLFLVTLG